MPTQWAMGITTVPQRGEGGLYTRTLWNLTDSGFGSVDTFIDDNPGVNQFYNYVRGLWWLYCSNPNVDRYIMFEDDIVLCKNVREYLEHTNVELTRGYWNLYCAPENYDTLNYRGSMPGSWYRSDQRGRGALALMFSNEGLRTLLSSKILVNHPRDAHNGRFCVDRIICEAMNKEGWKELVHNPSLVQHVGEHSTIKDKPFLQSPNFPGEDFDAMTLLAVNRDGSKVVK